jgi:hypothetical protein
MKHSKPLRGAGLALVVSISTPAIAPKTLGELWQQVERVRWRRLPSGPVSSPIRVEPGEGEGIGT